MKQCVISRRDLRGGLFAAAVISLIFTTGAACAQVNVLSNPGFELAEASQGWAGISNWYSSANPSGGDVVTGTDAHGGTNVMRMFAYGAGTRILTQAVSVVAGEIYEADGWLRTPPGAGRFTPTNGYAAVAITFANASGGRVGTTCESPRFGVNGQTNWTKYSTGPCQAPAGAVKAKITCQYSGSTDATTNGFVYFDDMRTFTSQVARAGALLNPDFETQPAGTLTNVACWMPFGVANNGIVVTNYSRGGRFALKLGYTETLLGQAWSATAGVRYTTSGYMFSPTGDRFTSTTNCHGVVLLQYFDSTGTNQLGLSFESAYFYPTSPADSWISFEATGVAPAGTASGRTMCAILGAGDGYAGSIYFDDMNQGSTASTTTQAGVIYNPGFEDGLTGDAFVLSNNLPRWTWYGGSNAGFVVSSASYSGNQSLAIVYPGNLAGQNFPAVTGRTYTVEGYMMTPSADRMTSTTAYATFLLEFFTAQGGVTSVSVVGSVPLNRNSPSNTWIKFGVTNRAPWTGTAITGRVSCALFDFVGTPYGGTVYFDSVKVTETTVAVANTQSGTLWNPGFEYSPDGTKFSWMDSWTGLGLAGNVDSAYVRTGNESLKIYSPQTLAVQLWPATPGYTYSCGAYAYTPSGADRFMTPTNAHGVVLLQYFDATGTNELGLAFESPYFTTATTVGAWTYLSVTGKAPLGAVYGRTALTILGTNTGYSGALWFDDATQATVSTGGTTQAGVIYNPGFEDGLTGDAFVLSNNLPRWTWYGGSNAGFVVSSASYSGNQSLAIVYPGNLAGQNFPAVTGRTYTVEGYMMTPSTDRMTSTTAYATFLLEFFTAQGGVTSVSVVGSVPLNRNSPSNTWIKFGVTNRAPWTGTAITGRVSCALFDFVGTPYGGTVYFDSVKVTETTVAVANTQSGTLWNPGFEYSPDGTKFSWMDNWTGLGLAGSIDSAYVRTGNESLKMFSPQTLAVQLWPATPGYTYSCGAYAYTPSGADRFTTPTNAHGVVLLQYFDATGTNELGLAFESPYFTTATTVGAWTYLSVTGKAPLGAVYGRTALAILGTNTGYSGSLWFDDATQATVSTGGTTQAGLLYNPGFDDGFTGDAYFLSNNLPRWTWYGGSNAGFVVSSASYSGNQSLAIVYPGNLAGQNFPAVTGRTYTVEGYMMTPSADKMTSTTAYATFLLEFFTAQGGPTSVSVVGSVPLNRNSPSNTWIKFGVTNRAPWTGTAITGRVSCALFDFVGTPYGGTVYFDSVKVTETTVAVANTQSGTLWNPGFEYSPDGTKFSWMDSWTGLGLAGSIDSTYTRTGNESLKMFSPQTLAVQLWPATPGYTYSSAAYAYTPSGTDRFTTPTNAHGVVLLQYFDATGTNELGLAFESPYFTTATTVGAWTYLSVTGKAPLGAVYGRTALTILGTNTGYSGSLWFDDATQATVSTGGTTQAGVIYNPGFEDGLTGDAFLLSNNLPRWTWYGGSNAGFVVSSASYSGNQSLAIVYPGNLAGQNFPAVTGRTYTVEGYMMTPSSDRMTSTTAYATFLLEFFTAQGGPTSVSVVASVPLNRNSPSNTWIKFGVTNRAPWTGTAITGRVSCALFDFVGTPYGGTVYFDSVKVTETTVAVANTQSGTLWNPGFEYSPDGTKFSWMDSWTGLGLAGSIDSAYTRTGNESLKMFSPQTLAVQLWPATPGYTYSSAAYAYTPSGTDRFTTPTNAHGVVLLQYFDATGTNELGLAFESPYFTTATTVGAWTYLAVTGKAPLGAVYGRTALAILGTNTGYSGSLWFDDATQATVSTGGTTQAGLLYNPGFEDGFLGNAYYLSNGLPRWTWYGGSNAGFVTDTYKSEGSQAFSITFPDNLVGQWVNVTTGRAYVVEGYISSPVGQVFSNAARATISLQFFDPAYQNGTASVSSVESAPFGSNFSAGVWHKFSVTNRAPWSGSITGRVLCSVAGAIPQFGGAAYFDQLSMYEISLPITNSQSGGLWNPGFEYTAAGTVLGGVDNWTALGEAGSVNTTIKRSGANALRIFAPETLAAQTWSATQGWKYASSAYALTPSSDRLAGVPLLHGVVLLQFLNATNGVLANYESAYFTTNNPADAWTNLAAMGVAPAGTVYGRTVVGLLGTNTGFGGSIYFDDVNQWIVATNGTTSGLLRNPGFEDGPLGNAYDLDRTNDLAGWKWFGGNSAGYITRDRKSEGLQSLVMTYAQNYMVQDFTIARGSSGANLLANPGFEIGPAGGAVPASWWRVGDLGQQNWAQETGSNGVAFASWVNNNWGYMGQDVPVDNSLGSVYTLTIRGNAESGFRSFGNEAYLKMEFCVNGESTPRYVVTNNVYGALIGSPGAWNTYTLTVTNNDPQVNLVKPVVGYGQANTNVGGSMAVKWDNATLTQTNATSAFRKFVAEGYLFTPSAARFSTDGTSYGELQLSFYCNGSTNPAAEFTAVSESFGGDRPADTWIHFAVTGTAPAAAICTGRLSCVIQSSGDDSELGGVIYYDQLSLTEVGSQTPSTPFGLWQLQNFGRTNGANVGADDDYDGDFFPNWSEYIAGTEPTNNHSLLEAQGDRRGGGRYVIQWPSAAGRHYTIRRWTNILSGASMVLDSNIAATVPVNAYTDAPPASAAAYYYRVSATTNQP